MLPVCDRRKIKYPLLVFLTHGSCFSLNYNNAIELILSWPKYRPKSKRIYIGVLLNGEPAEESSLFEHVLLHLHQALCSEAVFFALQRILPQTANISILGMFESCDQ